MFKATRDTILPATITGSYPCPAWFSEVLRGRAFKDALGDSPFREQYLDAVSVLIREQERAGLDIVTDGDSRFDLTVGGKSWFSYPTLGPGAILVASILITPPAAEAQAGKRLPRIGYLSVGSTSEGTREAAFWQGLRELGYTDGQNIAVESRRAEGKHEPLPTLAGLNRMASRISCSIRTNDGIQDS